MMYSVAPLIHAPYLLSFAELRSGSLWWRQKSMKYWWYFTKLRNKLGRSCNESINSCLQFKMWLICCPQNISLTHLEFHHIIRLFNCTSRIKNRNIWIQQVFLINALPHTLLHRKTTQSITHCLPVRQPDKVAPERWTWMWVKTPPERKLSSNYKATPVNIENLDRFTVGFSLELEPWSWI